MPGAVLRYGIIAVQKKRDVAEPMVDGNWILTTGAG